MKNTTSYTFLRNHLKLCNCKSLFVQKKLVLQLNLKPIKHYYCYLAKSVCYWKVKQK